MKKYQVTGKVVTISSGVVKLSKDQADPRMFNLKALGKEKYQVIKPLHFKRGEMLGFDGDLPKSIASEMTDQLSQTSGVEIQSPSKEEAGKQVNSDTKSNSHNTGSQ